MGKTKRQGEDPKRAKSLERRMLIGYYLRTAVMLLAAWVVGICLLYFLDTGADAPVWLVAVVGAAVFVGTFFLAIMSRRNRPSNECDVELEAELLARAEVRVSSADNDPEFHHEWLYEFTYEYEGKTYEKTLKVSSDDGVVKYPLTIRICSSRPRRCYIVVEKP